MADVAVQSATSTADAHDLVEIQLSAEVTDDERMRAYLVHGLRCLGAYDPLAFKMCWVRAPAAIRQNHVLQHCRQLALALQRREFALFWELIDAFIWDDDFSELVDDLRKTVREHVCKVIGSAYSCIEVSQVRLLMGVPAPASLNCWFPGHRTEIIAGQSYLIPTRTARPAQASVSFDQMRAYVQHMLNLDDVAL